jgi:hypothetical protein
MCTSHSHWTDRQGELCTHLIMRPVHQVFRGWRSEYKEYKGGFNLRIVLDDYYWCKLLQILCKLNTLLTSSYENVQFIHSFAYLFIKLCIFVIYHGTKIIDMNSFLSSSKEYYFLLNM